MSEDVERWPPQLPQAGLMGVTGGPQNNKISFQPEIGTSIDRRRGSSSGRVRDVEVPPISGELYQIFRDWFEQKLFDGVKPFLWTDAFDGKPYKMKFVNADPPYTETKVGPDLFALRFKILVLRNG